jgi:NitT/TauT family transport system substrate-binding protein
MEVGMAGWLRCALVCFAVMGLQPTGGASAASSTVRITQQFGLSYLPLHVALDRKLIEKHATRRGVQNPQVEAMRLASGTAVNAAIIAGQVDVAMAGATVLLNLWDRTVGRNTVKGMMAIADTPIYFNAKAPHINSIRDFRDTDRIAMTAGRGTQHSLVLQMAAAREFGWENREKLDSLNVSMPHPDGVAALLNGVVQAHATTVPFIQMELADPKVRTVLKSNDVVGGRHTLKEAMDVIKADKRAAAELFKRVEGSKMSVEEIEALLRDEEMIFFSAAPSKILPFAEYMQKTGLLKNKVTSWKDVFFEEIHDLPGN